MRNYDWKLLVQAIASFIIAICIAFMIAGCSDDEDKEEDVRLYSTERNTKTITKTAYNRKATFTSYGVRNGGRQAWRIPRSGPYFGRYIKVVFSNGHTVMVKDTSHNYRESDGFVFKPGIGPNGEGSSDTGTTHGGVYLHAPYGNSSRQVTFYFKR